MSEYQCYEFRALGRRPVPAGVQASGHRSGRRDEKWQQVEKPTVFSKPKEYDQATQLLWDLHAIARREDDIAAFTRVRELLAGNDGQPDPGDIELDNRTLPLSASQRPDGPRGVSTDSARAVRV